MESTSTKTELRELLANGGMVIAVRPDSETAQVKADFRVRARVTGVAIPRPAHPHSEGSREVDLVFSVEF
jgi:hypothetical protein